MKINNSGSNRRELDLVSDLRRRGRHENYQSKRKREEGTYPTNKETEIGKVRCDGNLAMIKVNIFELR